MEALQYPQLLGTLTYVVEQICQDRVSPNFVKKSLNEHLFLHRWIASIAIHRKDHELYDEMMQLCAIADQHGWPALIPAQVSNAWVGYYKRKGK